MQNFYPTWLNAAYYQNIPHNEVNWAQLAQQWMAMRDQQPEVVSRPAPQVPQALPVPGATTPVMSGAALSQPIQQIFPQQQHQNQQQQHGSPLKPQTPVANEIAPHVQQDRPGPCNQQQVMTSPQSSPVDSTTSSPRPVLARGPPQAKPEIVQLFPSAGNQNAQNAGLLPTPAYQQRHPHRPVFPPPPMYDYGNFGPPMGPAGSLPPPRPLFGPGPPMPPFPRMRPPPHVAHPPDFFATGPDKKYPALGVAFANQYSANFEEEEFYTQQDVDYRKWKPPLFHQQQNEQQLQDEFYEDTNFHGQMFSGIPAIDMQQRKNLPAWIREGLEKMEREKAKQKEKEEQEKYMKEREEAKKANKKKSRFESDSEEDEKSDSDDEEILSKKDNMKEDTSVNYKDDNFHKSRNVSSDDNEAEELTIEEQKVELLKKLRIWLTEILMTVTTSEIEKIVHETYNSKKISMRKSKRAQPQVLAQSSAALATIIGLGSDQDSASDDEQSDDLSDSADASTYSRLITGHSGDFEAMTMSGTPKSPVPTYSDAKDSQDEEPQGRSDFFKRPMLPPPGVVSKIRKVTTTTGASTADITSSAPAAAPATIIERIRQSVLQKEPPKMNVGISSEILAKDSSGKISGTFGKPADDNHNKNSDSKKRSSKSSSHSKNNKSSKSDEHRSSRETSNKEKSSREKDRKRKRSRSRDRSRSRSSRNSSKKRDRRSKSASKGKSSSRGSSKSKLSTHGASSSSSREKSKKSVDRGRSKSRSKSRDRHSSSKKHHHRHHNHKSKSPREKSDKSDNVDNNSDNSSNNTSG